MNPEELRALHLRYRDLLEWDTAVAAQPRASAASSASHFTDRQLVSLEHAVALVSAGSNITVEVLSDWAPDAETASVRYRYFSVKSGMIVTMTKQAESWWYGFDAARNAKGWLPDVCFVVYVINKAFKVDRSLDSWGMYLNLDIGDEVVVKDKWDQGPWKGWARGEKRSTNGASTGLFPVSCAKQHVITVSRRDRSRSRQNQPRSRES